MSEPQGEGTGSTGGDIGENTVAPPTAVPAYRGVAMLLAAVLLIVAALAGTAPFWAPSLPWAPPAATPRIDRIEQTLQQIRQEEEAAATARQQLARRITGLEARSAAPPADLAELRQQVAKLAGDAADLDHRIAAIQPALQAQAKTSSQLAARVDALDKRAHRDAAAASSDAAIPLVLLQIHEALQSGQAFGAEYDALTGLLKNRPEVAAAAAPLDAPAKSGVASRAALLARLRQLGPTIVAAKGSDAKQPPGPAPQTSENKAANWRDALLDRLRGLVRIRRVDRGAGQGGENGGSTGVPAAEQALAVGDLAGAVAALDKLDGAAAAAARPWLAMAKQRLAAETALRHLKTVLAAQLAQPGDAASAPGKASGKASGR